MMSFKEFIAMRALLERLRALMAEPAGQVVIQTSDDFIVEGKWLKGDYDNEIRIDRATHLRSGEKHAHVHDRKGNEMYAIRYDGKPSHGSKPFKLTQRQGDVLRSQGFKIKKNNIVEAVLIEGGSQFLTE